MRARVCPRARARPLPGSPWAGGPVGTGQSRRRPRRAREVGPPREPVSAAPGGGGSRPPRHHLTNRAPAASPPRPGGTCVSRKLPTLAACLCFQSSGRQSCPKPPLLACGAEAGSSPRACGRGDPGPGPVCRPPWLPRGPAHPRLAPLSTCLSPRPVRSGRPSALHTALGAIHPGVPIPGRRPGTQQGPSGLIGGCTRMCMCIHTYVHMHAYTDMHTP